MSSLFVLSNPETPPADLFKIAIVGDCWVMILALRLKRPSWKKEPQDCNELVLKRVILRVHLSPLLLHSEKNELFSFVFPQVKQY